MTSATILAILAGAVAGFAVGLAYFLALWRTVRTYALGTAIAPALGFTAFRIALALGAFWLVAQWGAPALIAAAAGFTGARLALHRLGEKR